MYGAGSAYAQPTAGPGYPPPTSGYPPQAPRYPPQAPGYPPPAAGYAPQATGYAPPAAGYLPPVKIQGSQTQGSRPTESGRVLNVEAPSFAGTGFDDKTIRLRFIRKVYLILTAQLLVTLAFIAFFLFHKPTKKWVQRNGWFYYISYGIFLVTYITLVCCKGVRRKTPGNYICLIVFTFAFSYMAATISSYYDVEAVLIAMGITCGVCIGVTLFAMQTKFDFTRCGGLLFCLLLVLLLFGLSVVIVYAVADPDHRTAKILQCVYGLLGALVFSFFLAYDTQMIVGGRRHEYSEEDYISASVQLYLDVVYIFIFILTAVGGSSS